MAAQRALFTICSNNYVPMAKVLLESIQRHHPEADVYLCLADDMRPEMVDYPDACQVIAATDLNIDDFRGFAFRYDIMEFNTAVKPFMFRALRDRGHEHVVYLDPDIEVYAPLDKVFALLEAGASFVLTPHMTKPAERNDFPDDVGIMRAGVYNLGFLGVGAAQETEELLRWWSRRLQYDCVNEPDSGRFVDQKFMDLIPGFAARAQILRDTAYNVAYWNLHQRTLTGEAGAWLVDGEPLCFFHFSGIDPLNPQRLSKYTQAFRDAEISHPLADLMRRYASRVLANGHGDIPLGAYAYGRFASGTPIPKFVRRMFRDRHVRWLGGDPFATYEDYLHLPSPDACSGASGQATRLLTEIHHSEPGLRHAFDLSTAQGVDRYLDWFRTHGRSWFDGRAIIAPRQPIEPPPSTATDTVPLRCTNEGPAVTVVGYLRLALGVGEAGRQMLRALDHGQVPARGLPVRISALSSELEQSLEALFVDQSSAPIEVFNINADQLPLVVKTLESSLNAGAWRAVMPFWELENFPAPWLKAFDLVDEVWAPTRYIQAMLEGRIDKPVRYMPLMLTFETPKACERSHFGLEDGVFVFFFSFDCLSFVERKNPMAVVRAFRRAFRQDAPVAKVRLVIKALNADKLRDQQAAVLRELRSDPDVHLMEDTLSRSATLQLIDCCDAVVSLHRSEGLGLLIAEAMELGKPVVATDYSATTELVSTQTGWPVDYRLVAVPEGHYPFHAGQVWAEPDETHAAWQMRSVYLQADEAGRRARNARDTLHKQHGPAACAQRLRNRIAEVLTLQSTK
jgi:glycosyltransferase involved in cell wall biosynthesis